MKKKYHRWNKVGQCLNCQLIKTRNPPWNSKKKFWNGKNKFLYLPTRGMPTTTKPKCE